MSAAWIDQLRALRDNATDGPWQERHEWGGPLRLDGRNDGRGTPIWGYEVRGPKNGPFLQTSCGDDAEPADAEFIAQAANLWPLLLDAIQAADQFRLAYANASIADEEGLASVEDFRAAWLLCDRAAQTLADALGRLRQASQ